MPAFTRWCERQIGTGTTAARTVTGIASHPSSHEMKKSATGILSKLKKKTINDQIFKARIKEVMNFFIL
jgi:hypothetical protein